MTGQSPKPLPTIRTPEAFRGLDTLVERVSQIVQRAIRAKKSNPVHMSVQKSA
jgi:hypothetical protein